MTHKLDAFEQDIEDNFEKHVSDKGKVNLFHNATKQHLKNKRSITLRVAEQGIEAIKIKASKCGIPYQTYINTLIHLDATKL